MIIHALQTGTSEKVIVDAGNVHQTNISYSNEVPVCKACISIWYRANHVSYISLLFITPWLLILKLLNCFDAVEIYFSKQAWIMAVTDCRSLLIIVFHSSRDCQRKFNWPSPLTEGEIHDSQRYPWSLNLFKYVADNVFFFVWKSVKSRWLIIVLFFKVEMRTWCF